MGIILLGLLAFVQPGDTNIYGGMNSNIYQFSRYWEWVYERSPSGFRTSQGCTDFSGWYQVYDAKTEAAFNRTFSLRYRFQALYNYDDTINDHRFEPTMRIFGNFYTHIVIIPYYKKNHNEAGVGIAWRRGHTDWLAFYALVKRFDHNFSLMHMPEGPTKDPFEQIPYEFEIDARGELDWARVRLHADLGIQSHQHLDWPDSIQYVWDRYHDSSAVWGRLELRPVKNLWLGSRFSLRWERTETRWRESDSVTFDTLRNFWVEPFVSIHPTERLEFRLEYKMWDVRRDMDSVTYYSDYDILSTLASWHALPVLVIEAGYQRSRRYRYNNDTLIAEPWDGSQTQSRLLVNLELRLKSGMMLVIKEGLEMDFFPKELFRSPHNHTYVSLHLPLALPRKGDSNKIKGL